MTGDLPIFSRLQHGVNLSHWYGQVYMEPGYRPEHFDSYLQDSDIQLITAIGFDHVRFALSVEHLAYPDGRLVPDFSARVMREIRRLHDSGLTVIVDLHPENDFKDDLAQSDEAVARFVRTWSELADRLADTDPNTTALEILNEPGLGDADRWAMIAQLALEEIRRRAPGHPVIVGGDNYSSTSDLLALPPMDDPNLVYTIHLYDPVAFTHQGAYWSPSWVQQTIGLEYPASRDNAKKLLDAATDERAAAKLMEYADIGWSRHTYSDLIEAAADFARQRSAPLICNEFGVYQKFVSRQSRLTWLSDVTSLFAEHGVGWTVWDYAGEFGVAVGERGHRMADLGVTAALGLTESRSSS